MTDRFVQTPLSTKKIGYVDLHCPGRWGASFLVLAVIPLVIVFVTIIDSEFMFYLLSMVGILPALILLGDVQSRRKLLKGKKYEGLASEVQQLSLRWLYFTSGKGVQPWKKDELSLPQTVADVSMEEFLQEIHIPEGLIEPELVQTSQPGSMFGCLAGLLFSLFFIGGAFTYAMRGGGASIFGWLIVSLLLWNMARLVLGLPFIHRSRKLPAILRTIGRGKLIGKSFVVGPGWVKFGKQVWRCDRDMLLIRRTGYRSASAEIECMFAGPEKKRRLKFSGVHDDDFKILFGAWHVDEVRFEFVDSELS